MVDKDAILYAVVLMPMGLPDALHLLGPYTSFCFAAKAASEIKKTEDSPAAVVEVVRMSLPWGMYSA